MEPVYLFSFWIFIWWMLYKLRMIPHSPIFALWFAAWFTIILIFGMIVYQHEPPFIFYVITVSLTFLKLLPLATLREPITKQSVYAFVVLLLIYLGFSYATGMTLFLLLENYTNIIFAPEKTFVGKQYEFLTKYVFML